MSLSVDMDFVGDDIQPTQQHQSIMQIAKELKIHVEPVPIEGFIPSPEVSRNEAFLL